MIDINNEDVLKCRLDTDKRFSKIELGIQSAQNSIENLTNRMDRQEKVVDSVQELSKSVSILATNMEGMLKEQKVLNERIKVLENKPIKRFDTIIDTIVKILITTVATIILVKMGLGV